MTPERMNFEVRELAASRAGREVFANVSFSLEAGQLLHIEGANGTGKTTLLRSLCGFIRPDAGGIFWMDRNIDDVREEYLGGLNYVGHQNGIKSGLTCQENLAVAAALAGGTLTVDHCAVILRRHGLEGYDETHAGKLSAGQRRRLALARLSLREASLWILDEPFTSLDVHGRQALRGLFTDHLDRGGMIVMTSHDGWSWPDLQPRSLRL